MKRVVLTPEQRCEVASGHFVRVGPVMKSVLVGRVGEVWKAYENECRHRVLPLDLGAKSPMSDDGRYLLCHQHGALYRTDDGKCVVGPCVGESLRALEVKEVGEEGELEIGG